MIVFASQNLNYMDGTVHTFLNTPWFNYGLLPFLIFLARIGDVSIGTLRIIFVSKGNKVVAPILGFFEVLIWIIAITRIMENLDNPVCYVAYAAGFATGNYVGLTIEEKLAVGIVMLRIITQHPVPEIIAKMNQEGYGATQINADGSKGKSHITFSILQRQDINKVLVIVKEYEPEAFITIEDIRMVTKGVFPVRSSSAIKINPLHWWRKGI